LFTDILEVLAASIIALMMDGSNGLAARASAPPISTIKSNSTPTACPKKGFQKCPASTHSPEDGN
jgi:hypothetical protein